MSETPDNEAGRGTEELMAALCEGQDVPTEIYNKCYSAVYELLRHIELAGTEETELNEQ
jgi:hypothetical protein